MHRYIVPEKVKKQVQSVLFLEDKIHTKKKDLTETEKTFLTDVRAKIKKYNMNISLKIHITSEDLSFRIRNDSPIHHLDF